MLRLISLYKMKKILPAVWFNPGTSRILGRRIIHCTVKPPYSLPINIISPVGFKVQWIMRLSSKRKVLGSNPTVDKNFHFVILICFACRTARQCQYKWNQLWHTPSQYPVSAREWYVLVHFSFNGVLYMMHWILNVIIHAYNITGCQLTQLGLRLMNYFLELN